MPLAGRVFDALSLGFEPLARRVNDGARAGPCWRASALPDPSYYQDETPVFFGHYWLRGEPVLMQPHAACLDYSVAKQGRLVGYRWHGEQTLRPENLVWA